MVLLRGSKVTFGHIRKYFLRYAVADTKWVHGVGFQTVFKYPMKMTYMQFDLSETPGVRPNYFILMGYLRKK